LLALPNTRRVPGKPVYYASSFLFSLFLPSNLTTMKTIRFLLFCLLVPLLSPAQTVVEQHPFLKWKAVATAGMTYSEIEIEPSSGTLLSGQIAVGSGYTLRVIGPKGFTAADGNAHFGIGVTVVSDHNPSENISIDDIYEGQDTGVGMDMLKSLSVEFTPGENYKPGEVYTVTASFFDRKGNGRVEITIPLTIAEETDASYSVDNYSNWQESPNVAVMGQSLDPGQSAFLLNGKPLTTLFVAQGDKLAFAADVSSMAGAKTCNWSLTDQSGATLGQGTEARDASWNGQWVFDFSTVKWKQPVLLTWSVEGNGGRIGFSEWFYYLGSEPKTTGDQAIFADRLINAGVQKNRAGLDREAVLVLENASTHGTGSNGLLYSLGYAYNEIDECALALPVLEQLTAKDPANGAAWYELGFAHKQLAAYEEALAAYLRCVALEPDHYFGNYQVGWTLIELGRHQESLAYLGKAMEVNPANYTQPYDERIYAYKQLGNLKGMIDDMIALAQLDPAGGEQHYYNIGYNKIEVGDYTGAVDYLTRAFEAYPYKYDAVYERGYAHKMMGNYALALADFNTAIGLADGGEPANTYLHLGDCQVSLGNKDQACENFRKARELGVAQATDRLTLHCSK